MRTQNGVKYPDSIAMAFMPIMFVCDDVSVGALEVTLTNKDGVSVKVAHDTFGGACYIDMSDYVQGMFGEVGMVDDYSSVSLSLSMHRMTYTVRKLVSGAWVVAVDGGVSFFVWGALARGETWGCNRHYKRTSGKPFMVDLLNFGHHPFVFSGGGVSVSVTTSEVGLYHVPIPSQFDDVELVEVEDSLGTAVIRTDCCDDGLMLRWIDRHGLMCHRGFYKGVSSMEVSQSGEYKANNLLNWSEDYGWSGMSGDGYIRTRDEMLNVCADGVTAEEYKSLMDVASSPMVEMMGDDGTWAKVRIDHGTWTKNRQTLQEMELTVIIDDVRVQK